MGVIELLTKLSPPPRVFSNELQLTTTTTTYRVLSKSVQAGTFVGGQICRKSEQASQRAHYSNLLLYETPPSQPMIYG